MSDRASSTRRNCAGTGDHCKGCRLARSFIEILGGLRRTRLLLDGRIPLESELVLRREPVQTRMPCRGHVQRLCPRSRQVAPATQLNPPTG
jgi:hypothetical protein